MAIGKWLAAIICVGLLLSGQAWAATSRPYFRLTDGDIFAGGWFNQGQAACSADPSQNYQAPTFNNQTGTFEPASSQYLGAILAFNKLQGGRPTGAAADFGVLAMGLIEGIADSDYGFASGITDANNSLSFANDTGQANAWGGLMAGTTPQTHCLPDYYGTKQDSPVDWAGPLGSASSGQYFKDGGSGVFTLNSSNQTINKNINLTLFVAGDVYIGGDIAYQNGAKANEVPRFVLVSLGNIYIGPNVGRLDGWYIAQPDTTSQTSIDATGLIWTCHEASANPPTGSYVFANCSQQLVVNGALSAKQVNLLRTKGDVGNSGSGNTAEIINFTPETIIGGPFFNQPNGGGLKTESLISLPPIF
ncbi:hypothetical protein HY380_02485 [Candidatus Saccharibacteria bacterium]|nr:hypothetical protein [Candidatus Saccharibacteria bacterium]